MSDPYLSIRRMKDGSIRLYAVKSGWDSVKKKAIKEYQIYIGGKKPDGTYTFNEKTQEFLFLLRNTEYERAFYQWQDFKQAQQTKEPVNDPEVQKLARCTDLCGGVSLLLGHVADELKLPAKLQAVFGETRADELLSLAYYCASQSRNPLYAAAQWSESQLLPGNVTLTEQKISDLLSSVSASDILMFLQSWLKSTPAEHRLSLDITSVSSYSKLNPDVMPGYNRDHEKLPQINLLMMVDQRTRLPVWFEQLPGAITDITTLKDTVTLLGQMNASSRKFVCDRGFASKENIAFMQQNGVKFTMGIPIYRKGFGDVLKQLKDLKKKHQFSMPGINTHLFEDYGDYTAQTVTKMVYWNNHRVYLHFYYCADYKTNNEKDLMERVNAVSEMLQQGKEPTTDLDKEIAKRCFTVSKPNRFRVVRCDPAAVDAMKEECGGYFVIASNEFKDSNDALYVYKLRDGAEKRFDDLKNEEDCARLRVHYASRMRVRLLIQFLAEILRCWLLNQKESAITQWKIHKISCRSINDIMRAMASLRYMHIEGHHPFYKRPTKTQLGLLKFFGISTASRLWWPSLGKAQSA